MSSVASESLYVGKQQNKRSYDLWLLVSAGCLFIAGMLSLYSIDRSTGSGHVVRQAFNAGLGVVVFIFFTKIKIEFWQKISSFLYVANIGLLVSVLAFGRARGVAQRWVEIGPIQFQPSELSKILAAITLAAFFARYKDRLKEPKTFVLAILHMAPIILLVLMQPHLGGALSLLVLGLAGAIYAGIPGKFFPIVIALVAVAGSVLWFTPGLMPDYMRERAVTKYEEIFLGETDVRGASYQQYQSMMAIGVGGSSGAGYLNGDLKSMNAVPEQHSDFIYSVVGEEGGFFGSLLVLGLYVFFFYRVWLVGFQATTMMGRVTAGCLMAVLAFHTIVNLQMVLMLGPVVGLWLPFMSYGGTALWMCLAAVGLLNQIE